MWLIQFFSGTFNLDYVSILILANLGWLNSLLELNILAESAGLLIRTPSLACLKRGSLKVWFTSILNFTDFDSWSCFWCLTMGLLLLSFLRHLICSVALLMNGLPVSPSYLAVTPFALQVRPVYWYVTPIFEQGTLADLRSTGSVKVVSLQTGQVFL